MPVTDPVPFARFAPSPHGWSWSAGPTPLALIDERHEHEGPLHCSLASARAQHHHPHHAHILPSRPSLRRFKRHSVGSLSLQTTPPHKPATCSRLARSLTSPTTPTTPPYSPDADLDTMASPGSPPALSSSHSSNKSSSIASSRSHQDDDANDISNFEDISLADAPPAPSRPQLQPLPAANRGQRASAPAQQQQQQQHPHRPSLRPNPMMRGPRAVKSTSNLRDVSNGLRASVTLNNHVRSIEQRSPTFPSARGPFNPRLGPPSRHSRPSVSPPRRDYRFGPMVTSSPTPPGLSRTQTDMPITPKTRRSPSQQRPRKTAAELEAEYDDLDDDLPDDVFMSNVPISPWSQGDRSGSTSPQHQLSAHSPDGSVDGYMPQRPRSWDEAMSSLSVEAQELSLKLETHATTLSRRNSAESTTAASKPPSPTRPGLSHSKSAVLPPVQGSNLMIDPLPASKEKEKHLARTRPSWLPPKNPKEEKKHLKEYQKMMNNFLESEKRKSADAEKASLSSKRNSKDAEAALRTWRAILGDWDNEIHKKTTRELWWQGVPAALRGQVWSRALGNDLHLNATGFKAALSRAQAAEERLSGTDRSHASMQVRGHARNVSAAESRQDQRARRSLKALEEDIEYGAFPSMGIFQKGQSRHRALRELLLAYAAYREDTGHVRGTAGIAALLLLQFLPAHSGPPATPLRNSQIEDATPSSPSVNRNSQAAEKPLPTVPESSRVSTEIPKPSAAEEAATASAFVLLANLLNRPLSLALCLNDTGAKSRTFTHVRKALRTKLPRLEQHLGSLTQDGADGHARDAGLSWGDVAGLLCKSLLTSHLNASDAARAWDVLMFEGDGVVVRGVVAVLARLEPDLYGSAAEVGELLSQAASAEADAKVRLSELGDDWVEWLRWAGREDGVMPSRRR